MSAAWIDIMCPFLFFYWVSSTEQHKSPTHLLLKWRTRHTKLCGINANGKKVLRSYCGQLGDGDEDGEPRERGVRKEKQRNRDTERTTDGERTTHCHSNTTRKTHKVRDRKKLGKIHYFRKVFKMLLLQRWTETWVPSLLVFALCVNETELWHCPLWTHGQFALHLLVTDQKECSWPRTGLCRLHSGWPECSGDRCHNVTSTRLLLCLSGINTFSSNKRQWGSLPSNRVFWPAVQWGGGYSCNSSGGLCSSHWVKCFTSN